MLAKSRGADARIPAETQRMKFLPGIVVFIAFGATGPSIAADLGAQPYAKAPAYAAPVYNWTGFYIGGHVGGAISSNEVVSGLAIGNSHEGRLLGGVQGGADYQFAPNFLVGVEGQYSWLGSSNDSIFFLGGFVYTDDR